MKPLSATHVQKCVLLDADGVVQSPSQPFVAALEDVAGSGASAWLEQTFRDDGAVITGRRRVLPLLTSFLQAAGVDADPRDVYEDLWKHIVVHDDVLALVDSWRADGYRVCLATNQDLGRAEYMKNEVGYDRRMDGGYYSCDLGVGKPSARYFEIVLEDLGVEPGQVVFFDDSASNVRAARALGISAKQWKRGDDVAELAAHVRATL